MLPYLLHSSILLAASFLFYWLLIRKETYFALNRWLLIGSIVLSLSIPLITVPEEWSFRSTVVSEMGIVESLGEAPVYETLENSGTTFKNKVVEKADESKALTAETLPVLTKREEATHNEISLIDKFYNNIFTTQLPTLLWYTYLLGVVVFFLGFLVQLIILITKIYSLISFKDGPYRIVELVRDEAPYSFWNSIFINPSKYDLDTYNQIIAHEKIHIQQAHFLDKLIAEFLLIAFWFNPFVWLLRSAITNNLEYLTDASMLENGTEKQSYQMSLLKVSVPQHPLNLSTNYNNSFLKNRIIMMNSKKSSARSSWKYLFFLPLLCFSALYLNATESNNDFTEVSLENPVNATAFANEINRDELSSNNIITNQKTEANLAEANTETPTSNPSKTISDTIAEKTKTVTRTEETTLREGGGNGDSHTQISTHFDTDKGTTTKTSTYSTTTSSTEIADNKVVTTEKSIYMDGNNVMVMERFNDSELNRHPKAGHWEGTLSANEICFYINNSNTSKNMTWITTACFDRSELSTIPMNQDQDFFIKRVSGTMNFKGSFSGKEGEGTFSFKKDDAFESYLSKNGMRIKKDQDLLHLFLGNIDKEYINNLTSAGFKPDGRDLIDLSIHGVDKKILSEYVNVYKELEDKKYKVRDLIQFQIHEVSPEYVNRIRALGLTDLNVDEIMQAKIHNVSPEYISDIRKAGISDIGLGDLIQFSVHGIEADYIKGFKEAGIKNMTNGDIIQAGIHGVDIDFVKKLKAYGIRDLEIGDVVQCSVHGVEADDINDYRKMGFDKLEVGDFVQAKIHGISPKYVKGFQELGIGNKELSEYVQLKIHGVSSAYIKGFQDLGFTEKEPGEFVQAKIHGLTTNFVERARKKGHDEDELGDYVQLKIFGL